MELLAETGDFRRFITHYSRTSLKAGGGNPVAWLSYLERINVGLELCGHRFEMSHGEPLTQA